MRWLLLLLWAGGAVFFLVSERHPSNPRSVWSFLERLLLAAAASCERSIAAPSPFTSMNMIVGELADCREGMSAGDYNGRSLTKQRCKCLPWVALAYRTVSSLLLLLTCCWGNTQPVFRTTLSAATQLAQRKIQAFTKKGLSVHLYVFVILIIATRGFPALCMLLKIERMITLKRQLNYKISQMALEWSPEMLECYCVQWRRQPCAKTH